MESTTVTHEPDASASSAITPVPPLERRFSALDIGLLWFSASIAITEIWAGGLAPLTGLGFGLGVLAIVAGRVVGNGLMGAMGNMGAATGLPGIVLSRPALGRYGSYLLATLNVVQLLGWTGWMLFVGFNYCDILAAGLGLPTAADSPAMKLLWVGSLTLLCIVWAAGGQRFWRIVQSASALLLAMLSVAMTVVVLSTYNAADWLALGTGSWLGLLGAADLVTAMSVSWVPLVADYARYAKSPRAGAAGTFWGYFVGGTWMYTTGLLVALAAQTSAPDQMVIKTMGQAGLGWALLAVILVLFSTITTTFLDIFSTVVSAQSLLPRIPLKWGNIATGLIGAGIALCLDVFKYEPFLLAIGFVFLPAYSVVICDYFVLRRTGGSFAGLVLSTGRALNWPGLLAWLLGALVYDLARGWPALNTLLGLLGGSVQAEAWASGASLPCIAISALAYLLLTRLSR